MSDLDRRHFSVMAIVGGIGLVARAIRELEAGLAPIPSAPSVADGKFVWVTLPDGRTIRRVCRNGSWVAADPAA